MNEQKFKQILKEAFFEQKEEIIEEINKRFEKQEEHLGKSINDEFFKVAGRLTRHFDAKIREEIQPLKKRLDEIYDTIDGIVERIKTYHEERAAIVIDQDRHKNWITQLASKAKINLVPEP